MQPTKLELLCTLTLDRIESGASHWHSAIRPPSLTLGEVRQDLTAREFKPFGRQNWGEVGFLTAAAIMVVALAVFQPLGILVIDPGSPFNVQLPACDDEPNCNEDYSSYPGLSIDEYSPAMGFFGYAVLVYAVMHMPKIYRVSTALYEQWQVCTEEIKIHKCLELLPAKSFDRQSAPSALTSSIIDCLAEPSLRKLSFAQLDAYRKINPLGFKRLLHESPKLNPQQRSYWLLLEHIEKAWDNSQEQQRILAFSDNLALLPQEPHLFEKILTVVQTTLSSPQHATFFETILIKHMLADQAAEMLIQTDSIRKIIEATASGRVHLEEAVHAAMQSSLDQQVQLRMGHHVLLVSPLVASHCKQWQKRANSFLLAQLSAEELQLFVGFLTSFKAEPEDYYTLLKVTAALKLPDLLDYFDENLARWVDEGHFRFNLRVVLPEIENLSCPLLKRALNAHLAKEESLSQFAQDLLSPPLDNCPYLASTYQACRAYLEKEIAGLAYIANPSAFAQGLCSYSPLLFQNELESSLSRWLLNFPSQGEALWELASNESWLQQHMLKCLRANPALLSHWNSPPL